MLIPNGAKLAFENCVRRNWYASQLLKLFEFAESNRTALSIFISVDIFVGCLVYKDSHRVLVAKPDQFRQRCLNGLRVFQRYDYVCVDEKLEAGHRSAVQRTLL